MARDDGAARRYLVFALVTVGHVLIVVLLLRLEELVAQRKQSTSPLLLLDLTSSKKSPTATPPDAAQPTTPRASSQRTPRTKTAVGSNAPSLGDAAHDSSSDLSLDRPIEWYGEAEQVAKSQAALIFKELKHVCDEAALRGEHPPGCWKYKTPDAWKPEPRTFGIEGGLPYVRLGKRCILGLGFFGCDLGKLPEANGRLFDDMSDSDRPRSSVPDPNE